MTIFHTTRLGFIFIDPFIKS